MSSAARLSSYGDGVGGMSWWEEGRKGGRVDVDAFFFLLFFLLLLHASVGAKIK